MGDQSVCANGQDKAVGANGIYAYMCFRLFNKLFL